MAGRHRAGSGRPSWSARPGATPPPGRHVDTARQVGTRDPDRWSDDELIPGMRYPDDADGWDR